MSETSLAIITELKSNEVMGKISASLGKPLTDPSVLKFITGAIMTIQDKPELARCSRQSIIDSVVNAASVQLPVDNQKLAYLVPRGGVCCFQPSYMGYISKVKEADKSADFTIAAVYKGDTFTFSRSNGQANYDHVSLNPFEDDPKKIVGMYCYLKTDTGSHIEIMSYAELMKVKAASPNSSGAIWSKWEIEMLKAKIARRSCKTKFPAAVAKLNALADEADSPRLAPAPTIAQTSALPPVQEAVVVNPEPVEPPVEFTKEELEAKAAEAKARIQAQEAEEQANKPAVEPEPVKIGLVPVPGQKVLKGLLAAYYPPKGKGPHSWFIQGEYAKTFDDEDALTLNDHRAKDEEVELRCNVEIKGQFTNNMIQEIVVSK